MITEPASVSTSDTNDDDEFHCLWKPFSLQFEGGKKEKDFQSINQSSWPTQDCIGLTFAVLCGPIVLFELRHRLPLWLFVSFFTMSCVMSPIFIFINLKHRRVYKNRRLWIVLFLKLGVNVVPTLLSLYLPISATFTKLMDAIILKSGTMTMLYTGLMFRLPFKQHLVVQIIALIESLFWIPPFCSRCSSRAEILHKFDQLAYGIDLLLSWLPIHVSVPSSCPCWVWSAFVMIIIGFILPTMIVYVFEVFSRAVFLQAKISGIYKNEIENHAKAAMHVAFRASVAAAVTVWYILSWFRID